MLEIQFSGLNDVTMLNGTAFEQTSLPKSLSSTTGNNPDSKVHGPTWAVRGPTRPRWAPCWPHEPRYLWIRPTSYSKTLAFRNVFLFFSTFQCYIYIDMEALFGNFDMMDIYYMWFMMYKYELYSIWNVILRPSYLHNGISYTGKITSLYWNTTQNVTSP